MAGAGATLLDLMQVQVGEESSWGTAVTPTAKLMGVTNLKFNPGVKAVVHHDRRGSLAAGYLANLTEVMPDAPLELLATYEDACYILDNLLGEATPSGSGPYTRDYAAPLGALLTPKILTFVYGDDTNCYQLSGGLVSKLVVKGSNGQPMTMTADLIGKDVTAGTLESLSDRTVNVAMGDHMAIYVDAWGGTIGTTAIAASAYAYELTIDAKRKGDQFLGGLAASNYHEDDGASGWEVMLKLSMEFNSITKAQYDALISQSAVYQKQIRLKSTNSTRVIQFDVAGTSEEAPTFGEDRDGVLVFEAALKGTYNSGLANYLKAQVINGVNALA
jgi:hypothetical protein